AEARRWRAARHARGGAAARRRLVLTSPGMTRRDRLRQLPRSELEAVLVAPGIDPDYRTDVRAVLRELDGADAGRRRKHSARQPIEPLEKDVSRAITEWCYAQGAIAVVELEQGWRPVVCRRCGTAVGRGGGSTLVQLGLPDKIVLWPPPTPPWWIEAKRPGGIQSDHQRR